MECVYYCPRCGRLEFEGNVYFTEHNGKCSCRPIKPLRLVKISIDYDKMFNKDLPHTRGFSKNIYEYIWSHYVDIPSNKKKDNSAFNTYKYSIINELNQPKKPTPTTPTHRYDGIVRCPKCSSQSIATMKRGFSVGTAAAGVVAAGPAGALAGGVGANNVFNVCQNCGHQWEPGK